MIAKSKKTTTTPNREKKECNIIPAESKNGSHGCALEALHPFFYICHPCNECKKRQGFNHSCSHYLNFLVNPVCKFKNGISWVWESQCNPVSKNKQILTELDLLACYLITFEPSHVVAESHAAFYPGNTAFDSHSLFQGLIGPTGSDLQW